MGRHLHLDSFSGISGDMFLGALIDAGLSFPALKRGLQALGISGYRLQSKKVQRASIHATKIDVRVQKGFDTPLSLSRIRRILSKSTLPPPVKTRALQAFHLLSEAEGTCHGLDPAQVHFHEVGVIDSLVDIVGSLLGCHLLDVTQVSASPINLGAGTIVCAHGTLPVPGPAVAELAKGLPVYSQGPSQEFATPTGMVLVRTLTQSFHRIPPFLFDTIGYGAGTANPDGWPNVLRVYLGSNNDTNSPATDEIVEIETNIDDLNPQLYDMVFDRLFAAGALDVRLTPVIMKHSRPGVVITVLSTADLSRTMADILFRETTTLGVRTQTLNRYILPRSETLVRLPQGSVHVKIASLPDQTIKWIPEYQDCRALAVKTGRPVRDVIHDVLRALKHSGKPIGKSSRLPRST